MKKMNNKGFSLVELIVVIAIMAVLVGVLAPQFIKYVEKSRQSTDITNLDSIKQVVESYYADREGVPAYIIIKEAAKASGSTEMIFKCYAGADASSATDQSATVLSQGGVADTKVKGTWDSNTLSAEWDTVNNTWKYVAKSKYYTTNRNSVNTSIIPE